MIDIHKRLHKLRAKRTVGSEVDSHIHSIASGLADEFDVICFDEFQVPSCIAWVDTMC